MNIVKKPYAYSVILKLTLVILCFLTVSKSGFCDEQSIRQSLNNDAATLFQKKDFASLESIAQLHREKKAKTPNGSDKLTFFYSGLKQSFQSYHQDEDQWNDAEQTIRQWVILYPNSPTPRLAYARLLLDHAYMYRGNGLVDTVDDKNWKPFNEYVNQAKNYLEENKAIAVKDPEWYELMTIVAYIQSWPRAKFNTMLNEGLTRYPYYLQNYIAATDFYAPKWGGDAALIDFFARESVNRTKSAIGYSMYARIYWHAYNTEFKYNKTKFKDSYIDWTLMRAGMEDILKSYPDQWNIDHFAMFSCMAGDKEETRKLIVTLDKPSTDAWGDGSYFQNCKNWANH